MKARNEPRRPALQKLEHKLVEHERICDNSKEEDNSEGLRQFVDKSEGEE